MGIVLSQLVLDMIFNIKIAKDQFDTKTVQLV